MICKICSSDAIFYEAVDLTKNCNENGGFFLPKSNVAIEYYQCNKCDFIFTGYFDNFSDADWKRVIYNDEYIKVDPLYPEIRPKANASLFSSLMQTAYVGKANPGIIDYGSGNGKFSETLKDAFDVINFDPYNSNFSKLPNDKFEIIFSSEVMEHAVSPSNVVSEWKSLLSDNGMVLFSTMLQPNDIGTLKTSWWYISPRNGHISIYSESSLKLLLSNIGMEYRSISDEWHIAYHVGAVPIFDMATLTEMLKKLPTGFIPI